MSPVLLPRPATHEGPGDTRCPPKNILRPRGDKRTGGGFDVVEGSHAAGDARLSQVGKGERGAAFYVAPEASISYPADRPDAPPFIAPA